MQEFYDQRTLISDHWFPFREPVHMHLLSQGPNHIINVTATTEKLMDMQCLFIWKTSKTFILPLCEQKLFEEKSI